VKKRGYILVLFILLGIGLMSCDEMSNDVDKEAMVLEVLNSVDITYASNNSYDYVTQDIEFTSSNDTDEIEVVWESSDSTIIEINGLIGKVYRQMNDETVTLTVTVSYDTFSANKTFTLTVINSDGDLGVFAPMILGVENFIVYEGSKSVDWLDGVYAIDDIDENLTVEVNDSDINLAKAGFYDLYYEVTDSDQLNTQVKVQVIVLKPSAGDATIETFDNLDLNGSSYTSGSFTGNNGIEWTYSGARGDQVLDGNALAFGGKIEDDSYLEATIDGGLSQISFDYDKPFTNGQVYDVLVNDTVIGSFDNSNGTGEFEQNNLNISGTYTLKIQPQDPTTSRRQMTLDNISLIPFGETVEVDEALDQLILDYKDLELIDETEENIEIDLKTTGENESTIVWEVEDGNEYIDLDSQTITVPTVFKDQIVLTATISQGEYEVYKTFVITVGIDEIIDENPDDNPDDNPDEPIDTTYEGTYYDDVDFSLTGDELKYELNSVISYGVGSRSYDYAKEILQYADQDPNNPNNVILVYTAESVKGEWDYPNWNREHVWPQSKLGSAPKGDAHNLKASDVSENSRRGNLPFGYGSSGVYEPRDEVKGDIARILFYMTTMYTDLHISSSTVGSLEMLIEWHELDPVDAFEINRNNVIYGYQGNRNPYIDFPDLVDKVFI